MRALVVTNLTPDPLAPQRGRWVADQVEAMRRRDVEIETYRFPVGRSQYLPAIREIRKRLRAGGFDLVHAHYGLAGWCAWLAGARPLVVTFHGTDVRHRLVGPLSRALSRRVRLSAAVSRSLFEEGRGRPGLPLRPGRSAVLPCGPDLERFEPIDRGRARRQLGLEPDGRLLLFPANPGRPEKRHDRAAALAGACEAELLIGGDIDPDEMPLWMNAADAVLVTSEYEGFGMAALEALSCRTPVLSTPVGIAPYALGGLEGCLVAPFRLETWREAVLGALGGAAVPALGVRRAAGLDAAAMADRVIRAYQDVLRED